MREALTELNDSNGVIIFKKVIIRFFSLLLDRFVIDIDTKCMFQLISVLDVISFREVGNTVHETVSPEWN